MGPKLRYSGWYPYLACNFLGFSCSARLIRRIGDGLLFLQAHNMAHWDMKANNILISQYLDAIIADLGESLRGMPISMCFDLHQNFASGNLVRCPAFGCLYAWGCIQLRTVGVLE